MPPVAPLAGANVLITLIDACAVGHLSTYGYERETAPFLDRLADESIVFEDVTAAAPYTLASVASIMTGEIVDVHDVTEAGDVLSEDFTLLAEAFREAGYRTFAASTNMRVHPRFGFDRGFDEFLLERPPDLKEGEVHVVPQKVLRHLKRELERESDVPFFGYYHFMPPHAPYAPADAHREVFAGHLPSMKAGSLETLDPLTTGARKARPPLRQAIVDLYDSSIHYIDSMLATIELALERNELLDSTLWVVLSDHGEAFGQHGVFQHSGTVYEEMIRVPLVIRMPGGEHGGRRIESPIGLVDVYPTLRALFGLRTPHPETSHSFADLIAALEDGHRDTVTRHAPILTRTASPGAHRALRSGNWKLVHRGGEKRYELYDLTFDPRERRDLSRNNPERLAELEAELSFWVREARSIRRSAGRTELDATLRDDLTGVGYVYDDPDPPGDGKDDDTSPE